MMSEEITNHFQQEDNNSIEPTNNDIQKENAGCLGIGASVLFPIIGVVIYFVQRKDVNNPSAYLWGALAGFIAGLVLSAAGGAF